MRSVVVFPFALAAFAIVACSTPDSEGSRPKSDPNGEEEDKDKEASKNDEEATSESNATESTEKKETTSGEDRMPGGETPPTPAGFPRAANATECTGGNGLYCNGHGVDGTQGTLYRCTDGQIKEEKKCATACIYLATGGADACDGDGTKCPRGSGLYCGTNYFSGDPKALLRCTAGNVTVEKACATSCVKEADGTPDRCE